jgi:hypothetical protein
MKLLFENWRRFSEGDVRISIDDELEPEDLEGGEKSNEVEYIYNLLINKGSSESKLDIDATIASLVGRLPHHPTRQLEEKEEEYTGQFDHLAGEDGRIRPKLKDNWMSVSQLWAGLQIFWLEYDFCRQLDMLDMMAAVYEYNDIREKVNDIEIQKGCI